MFITSVVVLSSVFRVDKMFSLKIGPDAKCLGTTRRISPNDMEVAVRTVLHQDSGIGLNNIVSPSYFLRFANCKCGHSFWISHRLQQGIYW